MYKLKKIFFIWIWSCCILLILSFLALLIDTLFELRVHTFLGLELWLNATDNNNPLSIRKRIRYGNFKKIH